MPRTEQVNPGLDPHGTEDEPMHGDNPDIKPVSQVMPCTEHAWTYCV